MQRFYRLDLVYKKIIFYLQINLIFFIILTNAHANDSLIPERIILNLTESPATSQAVTWRTGLGVEAAQAQITIAVASPKLDKEAKTVIAQSTTFALDTNRTVMFHSAIFTDLTPNTLYAYRVGDGKNWSEWNHFKTAHATAEPFQFLFFGDVQNGILSLGSRVFRAAFAKAPNASFWHFSGDIVNRGQNDAEWEELFNAFGWISRVTPIILLPGNHEYTKVKVEEKSIRTLNNLWRPMFTLPENGPEGLEESVYYLDYQGLRFIMLNGNEKYQEQAQWLEKVLSQNSNRWTVAAIHQPFYSMTKRRDNPELREHFIPLFDDFQVDIVLAGHDHSYGRTFKLRDGKIVNGKGKGTVYVVSVCGAKMYDTEPNYRDLMVKIGSGEQLFQVISINGNKLNYESWKVSGERNDQFELQK